MPLAINRLPENTSRLLIPVFYAVLDTADIASLLQFESVDVGSVYIRILRVLPVFEAFHALVLTNVVSTEIISELWPRIWAWADCIDTLRDHLPFVSPFSDVYSAFAGLFVALLRRNTTSSAIKALISSTSGVYEFLARAWAYLLRAQENFYGLCQISEFLRLALHHPHVDIAVFLEELVFGAGGSWTDLATLIVSHLHHVCPRPDSPITNDTLNMLPGAMKLMLQANTSAQFRRALWEQGSVPALTVISSAMSLSAPAIATSLPGAMLRVLTGNFLLQPAQRRIVEALRAGLLPALFIFALKSEDELIKANVLRMLEIDLPRATCFFTVLTQLRLSLDDVRDLDPATHFGRWEYVDHWRRFVKLVEHRLKVVEIYETGRLTALRACDSLQCGEIRDKRQLKRCNGCRMAYYCSPSCQKNDWRNGHRTSCRKLRARYDADVIDFSDKDRSFLRALLNYDYAACRENITLRLLSSMRTDSSQISVVAFDYSRGQCRISISRFKTANEKYLPMETQRVRQGCGRNALHFMRIYKGMALRAMPLRSGSARLYEGLQQIVDEMPPETADGPPVDMEKYRAVVRRLLESEPLQTH
ncbi:hypothetical protein GGX14DRAFT_484586 [Mycena pura]|uniref:MYND-type domain-containing protein n=1 Tax=Mycena pura TaxID=153505 RepID=A0AAD6ULB6_9AGAR|nr:hypothetical protein GGX14DRAFT_484586 [Mycena pura]